MGSLDLYTEHPTASKTLHGAPYCGDQALIGSCHGKPVPIYRAPYYIKNLYEAPYCGDEAVIGSCHGKPGPRGVLIPL